MSYDSWKMHNQAAEDADAIERLLESELENTQNYIDRDYKRVFGDIHVKFEDLTMKQIEHYLLAGMNLLWSETYLSFADLLETENQKENLYIIFLIGFNIIEVGLPDVEIGLYIKSVLLDADVADEIEQIIENKLNNI